MSSSPMGAIDALVARAATDPALAARLLDDPRGTIEAETGMTVPADWAIVASQGAGGVELSFANGELPEAYLDMVSGGANCAAAADDYAGGNG